MNNHFFGDKNDFIKYSLIRNLNGNGQLKTVICWLLTEDDRPGSSTNYLKQPDKWQHHNPVLYQYLKENVMQKGLRDINIIEQDNMLPSCSFFNDYIRDDFEKRADYFKQFFKFAQGEELVFVDPDNGLEINSVHKGRKKSSKYIYLNEIQQSYNLGHSFLLFQYFPREEHQGFMDNLVTKLQRVCGTSTIVSFYTSNVVFVLVSQPSHKEFLIENSAKFSKQWKDIINTKKLTL